MYLCNSWKYRVKTCHFWGLTTENSQILLINLISMQFIKISVKIYRHFCRYIGIGIGRVVSVQHYEIHSVFFIRNAAKTWLVFTFSFCTVVSYFEEQNLASRSLSKICTVDPQMTHLPKITNSCLKINLLKLHQLL